MRVTAFHDDQRPSNLATVPPHFLPMMHMEEKSYDKLETWLLAAQSQDSRSLACASDNLSEHYIRAKRFAALKAHKNAFKSSTDLGNKNQSGLSKGNKHESPPAALLQHLNS